MVACTCFVNTDQVTENWGVVVAAITAVAMQLFALYGIHVQFKVA